MRFIDPTLLLAAFGLGVLLLTRRIRDNRFWRATVTPLASIIGSGFLIVAPLLGASVGRAAPWAMLLIVTLAFMIGGIVRFNIRHAEPLLRAPAASAAQRATEQVANLSLFAAYVVSVAFYLRLLSAFVLKGLDALSETNARVVTTGILIFIAVAGWRRGLKGLERLEEYSVSIKLAVIGALLIGLGLHDWGAGLWAAAPAPRPATTEDTLRMLAGMLLVVQGFETSRFLGAEYAAATRIGSMRLAQALSGVIYVLFAFLILPLIGELPPGRPDETAIIDLSRRVAAVLPAMMIVAAVMSQFSAAIADTLGGGGLLVEESKGRLPQRAAYVGLAAAAVLLVWTANIFEIVAYASRAFAFYYLAETVLALQIAWGFPASAGRWPRLLGFGVLAGALAWIVVYAKPIG